MEKWNKIHYYCAESESERKDPSFATLLSVAANVTTCFIPFFRAESDRQGAVNKQKTLFGRTQVKQRWKEDANDFQADTFHVHISILIAAISKAHLLLCTR